MQSTAILAHGAALVQNAKDAVFQAIVGAALSQIAVMNYWGDAPLDGRKPQTLTTVIEGQRVAFGIAKGKTQANDWLAVATLIRKRMEKDCADTLALARNADSVESCFAMVLQDVMGQVDSNTIESLRVWGSVGKVAKVAKVKTVGEKILALCDDLDSVTDEEFRTMVAKIQAVMHNRAKVAEGMAQRQADKVAADLKAAKAAKAAIAKAAKLAKAA